MNRFIYSFLLLGCAASALVGCTADPELDPLTSVDGDGRDSWITINFCENSFDEINITTRATMDDIAESRVSNLFVFLFNDNGERVYGRFFDYKNRLDAKYELLDSQVDSWWVADNATANMPHGAVRMFVPAIKDTDPNDNKKPSLYILANVNSDMVNISPDKLRFVETLDDLMNMTATLNQEITERNGFFPMTGSAPAIEISGGTITSDGKAEFEVPLTRLDAKIVVKVRVAKGYQGSTTSSTTEGETGSGSTGTNNVVTTHEIDSFVPLSWQVVNLPRTAFVLSHEKDATTKAFTTRETKFETREADSVSFSYKDKDGNTVVKVKEPTEVHGFSFYMLENRPDPAYNKEILVTDTKGGFVPKDYHLRDTRKKNSDGTYKPDENGNIWEYAPAEGTYLVIKGEVIMALDISNEGKNQQLSADVEYYIHLGDFGGKDTDNDGDLDQFGNVNDYNILRNTSYTYTITIFGVDNIQVEVEKKTEENESGATGHVYVAKEQIFTFDSHFGRAVVAFDEEHITDIENLTWYVKTPFGREGRPHIVGGIEVPSGLDYQWVKFMVNERDNEDNYIKNHEKYNPEKVKDILEFSKYMKEQKVKFQEDKKDGHIDNESDFRREFDQDWYDKFGKPAEKNKEDDGVWYRYRIYVTIFVDEFYYTANPLTGDVRTDLWKDFVNKPNRMMHILCDADKSADEASRTTGSVVTIRQRSIQTVFNTEKPELQTAWGCETIDETRDVLWFYSRKERYDKDGNWVKPSDVNENKYEGNWSDYNGLFNTVRLWGLLERGQYTPKLWSDYVNYDRLYALCDDDKIETLRYSCLTRNRDENGNSIIDAAEIKWYMAAINQLAELYIGDQGLSTDAVLYPYYKQQITSPDMVKINNNYIYPWRAHVVSSTAFGTGVLENGNEIRESPAILWAEEGLSTGPYIATYGKSAGLTVRCVRNLGMDPLTEEEAQKRLKEEEEEQDDEKYIPEKAVQVSGPKLNGNNEPVTSNSVYKFDLTNLNPQSIRYYSSQELEPNDEHSVEARTYWAFETGILTDKAYKYLELRDLIKDGKSPCPEGYRVPNVREGALMSMHCPAGWQDTRGYVSTWYSHGLLGTDQDKGVGNIENYPNNEDYRSNSWYFNGTKIYLNEKRDDSGRVRCVKDIRQ